jgi:hypothetical protein
MAELVGGAVLLACATAAAAAANIAPCASKQRPIHAASGRSDGRGDGGKKDGQGGGGQRRRPPADGRAYEGTERRGGGEVA